MKLNEIQQNLILNWLQEKWQGGKKCNVFDHDSWSISDCILQMSEYSQASLVVGSVQPLIPVACSNCGNTLLINAITVGVIKPIVKESSNE